MKAMLLAAGEGTRLRPLTNTLPKPILPMLNRPLLEHTLELLAEHGVTEVVINLFHHPKPIRRRLGDGSRFGIHVCYSQEELLLGTAGAVKKVEDFFSETFLVIYGDNIILADLGCLVDFHRKHGGMATIALFETENPSACGIVELDDTARVTRFVEKPLLESVNSNTANAGVYVLEPSVFRFIPDSVFYDFGTQVFPAMVAAGECVYGTLLGGYLRDIGTTEGYLAAHRDLLRMPGRAVVDERAVVSPLASLSDAVALASGVLVREEAVISPWASIGENCLIGENATISESVLWDQVFVGPGARIESAILASHCQIGANAVVMKGAVLGSGCVVGSGVVIPEKARLMEGAKVSGNSG